MCLVLLLGPPGGGKTTLSQALGERLGCPHLELSIVPEFPVIAGVRVPYETDERIAMQNLLLWGRNYLAHGHRHVLLSDFRWEALPALREDLGADPVLPIVLTASEPDLIRRRVTERTEGYQDAEAAVAYNQHWRTLVWEGSIAVDVVGKTPEELTDFLAGVIETHAIE
jgi:predicted kinase